MNIFVSHTLQRPILFIILSIIFVAVIGVITFQKKNTNFADTSLLRKVYKKNTLWQFLFSSIVFLVTLFLLVIIWWLSANVEKQVIKKEGIDIQIVLDISYSMIAEDIVPTRIEAAKSMIISFLWELQSDRVGIILFSGKPFQSVPLSFDYDFLQDFMSQVSVDIVSQSRNIELAGTALWDGLILASDALWRDYPEREKVIILITDGEANKWVEPELALRLLKDQWIKTYTIGVWKEDETSILFPQWDFMQEIRIGWIDEEILRKISNETGAKYFRADSSASLQDILQTIAKLEKTQLEYEIYTSQKSRNIPVMIVLLMLVVGLLYIHFYKKIQT